jgi:hypothetical protein
MKILNSSMMSKTQNVYVRALVVNQTRENSGISSKTNSIVQKLLVNP